MTGLTWLTGFPFISPLSHLPFMPFTSPLSVFSLLQGHCLLLECIQSKPPKITHKMFLFVSSYLLLTSSYVCRLMLLLVSTSFMMLYQDLSISYLQIADNIYTNSTSQTFIYASSIWAASSHRLRRWHLPESH